MIARLHIAALALPVAFVLAVLGSTAANGRGGRGPTVLTDRDVLLGVRNDDRSIAEVFLGWSEPAGRPGAWVGRESLRSLGFDVSLDPADPGAEAYYRRPLSRRAFVAFEIDGPAWQAVAAERGRLEAPPGQAPSAGGRPDGPRLVPVDVDRNAEALADRYPDARTHLIAAAVIGARRFQLVGTPPYIGGVVLNVDPRRIQVPVEHATSLPVRGRGDANRTTPFTVSLMYGRRWEPWVVDVSRAEPSR